MLDLRRLQILAAVHAEGTMTAAAAALSMSTSAVSQHLSLLEREAGVPLLLRTGRNVHLTEAARTLVAHVERITAEVEAAETSLATFRTDVSGTVRISTFPTFGSSVLPEALMALRRRHPRLETSIRDLEPHQSVALLRSGQVDVAVVDDLQILPDDGLVTTELAVDEIVLCLPPERTDVPDPVSLAAFADERWILEVHGSGFEENTRHLCRAAGFTPTVVAHCGNVAALGLVRAGYGVTVMSSLYLSGRPAGVVVRRLDPSATRRVRALTRAAGHDSPAVQAVLREVRDRAQEHYASTT